MEGEVTNTMSTVLGYVGEVFTKALEWAGDVVTFITSEGNAIVLLFMLLPLVGIGIGFLKRIMH